MRLVVPTAAASAVLNNTPIVAMLAPQVSDWAEHRGRSPSRYLMPLSFAAILGGMVTTIGTSYLPPSAWTASRFSRLIGWPFQASGQVARWT